MIVENSLIITESVTDFKSDISISTTIVDRKEIPSQIMFNYYILLARLPYDSFLIAIIRLYNNIAVNIGVKFLFLGTGH